MRSEISIDPTGHADLHWYANGQSAVSGSLLELYRRLDTLFVRSACEWGAREYAVPTFVPARELAKIDYFHSFPQLVTFPVALDANPDNLRRVAEGNENTMPAIIEAVKAYATLGEIMDVFRGVFGDYMEPAVF